MSETQPALHPVAQRALLQDSTRLVKLIARSYACRSSASLDDLIQVGYLGLLKASQRYSSSMGVAFAHYARPHIRGAILHYLRDQLHLVRLPRHQHDSLRRPIDSDELQGPNHDLLRQWAALSRPLPLSDVCELENPDWLMLSGAQPDGDPGLEGDNGYEPTNLAPQWSGVPLQRLLTLVDARKRQVLECVVLQGWSYRRTAKRLGVSAPTVQRLLQAGLRELKAALSRPDLNGRSGWADHARSVGAGC